MNDALEILNDLEEWLKGFGDSSPYPLELQTWINNQRSLYEPAKGDCCG